MADYDNTNSGAAFKPFDSQSMILQGKVNVNGRDDKIVLVKDVTRNGDTIIEVYAKTGVLFNNDKKGNEAAPDYTGPLGDTKRIAAWRKDKEGSPYMSFKVSDKQSPQNATSSTASRIDDDHIPF